MIRAEARMVQPVDILKGSTDWTTQSDHAQIVLRRHVGGP